MLKDVHPQKEIVLTSFRTWRRLIRYEGCSIDNWRYEYHGEPVRKKPMKLDIFFGKKNLDKILEKKGDISEERDGAPSIWSQIVENGMNISKAVVIDAQEFKRLFLQLENEVRRTLLELSKQYCCRLSTSQAA